MSVCNLLPQRKNPRETLPGSVFFNPYSPYHSKTNRHFYLSSNLNNGCILLAAMKITSKIHLPLTIPSTSLNPLADSDLLQKPKKSPRRRTRTSGVRLKRDGVRSRPETPLLRWKVHDGKDQKSVSELAQRSRRKPSGGREVVVSARKLAAGLWRLQPPEVPCDGEEYGDLMKKDRSLNQQVADQVEVPVLHHKRDLKRGTGFFSGPRTEFLSKLEPSFHFSNSELEGATKWDPSKKVKPISGQVSLVSAVAALESELDRARTHIHELETEKHSSNKKLEQFLKKLSEERAVWRSREHDKIRAVVDDIRLDLNHERKTRKRMEMVNAKLADELADAKMSAKRFMMEYEKEKKARELTEVVCDELAKEIGDDKAEYEELKRESLRFRDEVEDERKMLQMAEVWREERVQMKLVDIKLAVEEKYAEMNKLVFNLEKFLNSKVDDVDRIRKGEILRMAADSINIDDITKFSYEPANPDIFSVFEELNFAGKEEADEDGDESGWETVTADGSDESAISEISEVRSAPAQHLKKETNKSRMWRSFPSKGDARALLLADESSSSEESVRNKNPHVARGIKGCIEWPRGSTMMSQQQQKKSDAKMENQKLQLRHVLKQKI